MLSPVLARFATVKYDHTGKNLWNPCMHLCNYSINKYHSDYIKSSDPDLDDQVFILDLYTTKLTIA